MERIEKSDQPNLAVYDDRVNEILASLDEGKTREEIAKKYDYTHWKNLDIYMRRRGFAWDGEAKNYIPASTKMDSLKKKYEVTANGKSGLIVSLFSNLSADAKEIAIKTGFKDHREMAAYMQSKGFVWSPEKKNYVENAGLVKPDGEITAEIAESAETENVIPFSLEPASTSFPTMPETEKTPLKKFDDKKRIDDGDSGQDEKILPDRYAELLEFLDRNKNKLYELLMASGSKTGTVPRFIVPGTTKTKSVYMSDLLAKLINEFSESKNISQRDIFESAIIEFLKKYGYSREIEILLKRG